MRRTGLFFLAGLLLGLSSMAQAATTWVEGKNYFIINGGPGAVQKGAKIPVTEVFSYGCPACNQFQPVMAKLKKSLPANAEVNYLPASFNAAEDWPLFQRAYLTAQALNVADKTHDAFFDAVWKTGELTTIDPNTHRLKDKIPDLDDVARFYQVHANVPPAQFESMAKSFAIETKIRNADQLVNIYNVDRTPSIVVNNKYLLQMESAGGPDQLVELVNYLVAKDSK
jgi:thiol:disulfide interchange protein DsbA